MPGKRVGKNLRPYLTKAHDSALLAVEVYNKPAVAFRSAGFIALMTHEDAMKAYEAQMANGPCYVPSKATTQSVKTAQVRN